MPYTIQSGDTLSQLAQNNNTDVASLMKANPSITNADKIQAGASINLPGQSTPVTAPAVYSANSAIKDYGNIKSVATTAQQNLDAHNESIMTDKSKGDGTGNPITPIIPSVTPPVQLGAKPAYNADGTHIPIPVTADPATLGLTGTKPIAPEDKPSVAQIGLADGTYIKQFADGTYGSFAENGKFQQNSTADYFQRAQQAKSYGDKIDSILNGTYPLNPNELAQLQGVKDQYNQMVKSTTSGLELSAARSGLVGQDSRLSNVVSNIVGINNMMNKAVADMTQSLLKDDYTHLLDSYNRFTDGEEKRQTAIHQLATDAQAEADRKRTFDEQVKRDNYDMVQKPIDELAATVSKYGAPKAIQAAVAGAKTYAEAVQAAAGYTNDPTSDAGQYSAYLQKGGTSTAGDFLAAKEYAKELAKGKAQAANAYGIAYNTSLGKSEGDTRTETNKQDKLEHQYSGTIQKEFLSSRTGDFGVQNNKVSQAIHLKGLYDQYKDPTTGDYNIPVAQYNELVMGLANLISPTGAATNQVREDIQAATAKGSIAKAMQYATGKPQTGNTQAIIKNMIDSIDRQGAISENLRDTYTSSIKSLAPTGLDADRKARLESATFPSFVHPDTNYTSPEQVLNTANTAIASFAMGDGIKDAKTGLTPQQTALAEYHQKHPNSTAVDVFKFLKDNGYVK